MYITKIRAYLVSLIMLSTLIALPAFSQDLTNREISRGISKELDKIDDFVDFANISIILGAAPRYQRNLYLPYNKRNVMEAESILLKYENSNDEISSSITNSLHEYMCTTALHPQSINPEKAVFYCESFLEGASHLRDQKRLHFLVLGLAYLRADF